jgi:hypothetical protein
MRERSALDAATEAYIEAVRAYLSAQEWKKLELAETFARELKQRVREFEDGTRRELKQALRQISQGAEIEPDNSRCSLRRKRGRHFKSEFQDLRIGSAVAMLVAGGPWNPTRRTRENHSACSVVKVALERLGEHIPERTIETIWKRYQQRLLPPR